MSAVKVVADALIEMAKTADEQARDPHADALALKARLHACAAWLRCSTEYIGKHQPKPICRACNKTLDLNGYCRQDGCREKNFLPMNPERNQPR